jgi:hypothetical protein
MLSFRKLLRILILALPVLGQSASAADWYIDANNGRDRNDGTSPATAWRSLKRASEAPLEAGDSLLLKRGSAYVGCLKITAHGTAEKPITIASYGEGALPLINAVGYIAGVHVLSASHVVVRDLEITGDGGAMIDGSPEKERFGVLVNAHKGKPVSHVTLRNLFIHDIYPAAGRPHEGKKQTTYLGTGIAIRGDEADNSSHFLVEACRIERTGFKAMELARIREVLVLDNHMKDIGGPAIQPGNVEDLVVRGNVVDGSGSSLDPRMHARGSGIWPWTSKRVLIEKNTFKHARGKADSCGIHIDYNCSDVVVQYNLSIDNEGGFIEILGNNHNSVYRYNISINDGARVKGKNGADQEGKVLWISGYVGKNKPKKGPFNSYIYNNTIYVGPDSRTCFSIAPSTEGLLIANNIFHIMGDTVNVLGDQDQRRDRAVKQIPRADIRNNLYLHERVLPDGLPCEDLNMLIGDPQFARPGGLEPGDYTPGNMALVQDRGIVIPRLEGDPGSPFTGLAVDEDFFGNPVTGTPDIGAVELQTNAH